MKKITISILLLISISCYGDISERIVQYCLNNNTTDFSFDKDIRLQDDGNGIYIAKWNIDIEQPSIESLPSDEDSTGSFERLAQLQKPENLKIVENKFMLFCQQLTGGTMTKLTFDQINSTIESLMVSDANAAIVASLKLLAIDAEAKREGGLKWWDTCEYHPEIVE